MIIICCVCVFVILLLCIFRKMALDQMSCFLILVGARVFSESAEDLLGGFVEVIILICHIKSYISYVPLD